MFWIRIHQPNEEVEPTIVRFSTNGLTLMTIEGKVEVALPGGEYSVLRVENPYGEKEDWLLVIGTNLGASVSNWADYEEAGTITVLE